MNTNVLSTFYWFLLALVLVFYLVKLFLRHMENTPFNKNFCNTNLMLFWYFFIFFSSNHQMKNKNKDEVMLHHMLVIVVVVLLLYFILFHFVLFWFYDILFYFHLSCFIFFFKFYLCRKNSLYPLLFDLYRVTRSLWEYYTENHTEKSTTLKHLWSHNEKLYRR